MKHCCGESGALTPKLLPIPRSTRLLLASLALWTATGGQTAHADEGQPAKNAQGGVNAEGALALPAITVKDFAGDQPSELTRSYTVPQSSSATKLPLSLKETPQSVTVVTRQRMDDQRLNTVKDVLNATTGVTLNSVHSDSLGSFYARGFPISNIQYDGIPSLLEGGSISSLDTALYDRVEIVRGATGLLSGAGDPSASVNLIRKRALRDFAASTSVEAGRWDYYRGTADISTPLNADGTVRARVVGALQDSNSFRDWYSQNRNVFYSTLEADISEDTTISAGYEYQKSNTDGNTWGGNPIFFRDGGFTHLSRSTNSSPRWNYQDYTFKTAFASVEHRFDNDWEVKGTYTNVRRDSDYILSEMTGLLDRQTGTGLFGFSSAGDGEYKQNAFDIYTHGPFELFGRTHDLVAGASYSDSTDSSNYTGASDFRLMYPGSPLYGWNGKPPKPPFDAIPRFPTATQVKQTAAYSAARFSLTDALTLIAGGRVTRYEANSSGPAAFGSTYTYDYKEKGEFTPYVGVVYSFNDTYSAFASYTEIFKPQANRKTVSGSPLDPTNGNSREIGLKADYFEGRLNASITVFETKLDNVAQVDPTGFAPGGDPAYTAVSGTKSHGVELELSGQITDNWDVFAGVSSFSAQTETDSRLSPDSPHSSAKLFTTYRLPGDLNKLTVGGGASWQDETYWERITSPTGPVTVSQKPYALASLMARYDLSKNLSLGLNVSNLFDKTYYTSRSSFGEIYGEPRSFYASLNYRIE